ncbi:hypothetical protein GCM10011391_40020 [Pullulanibacillus camelliae]|uniref:YolD-like family protein n=1 Tax=Pullulanibacillus camelliae TaxID=1707096 RepID=A0A8J2YNN2_9BACL|nr:hypothetical protein [Pullulanibacillus camelliae]GGE57105.1 hypothetical protein GCM10011391_40020 [Pullulanibacillus camelliae]
MLLKKLSADKHITIAYRTNHDTVRTVKGHVRNINLIEQKLSIKDEEKTYTIDLSCIKHID